MLQRKSLSVRANRQGKSAIRSSSVERLESRMLLTSVVVNTILDGAPAGMISLRDAIATANASKTPTTITFSPTVFATAKTITMNGTQFELTNVSEATTITGPAVGVTLSGNNASRIFLIDTGVKATMSGLTLTKGNGNANANDNGGTVDNEGTLSLTNVVITGNTGEDHAAGIYSFGTLNLMDVSVISNKNSSVDGGIANYGGVMTMIDSTVANNSALEFGGGIENEATMILINDTISGNNGGEAEGGGILNDFRGTATLTNVTITGNTDSNGQGGGICNEADQVTLANCIIAGNSVTGNATDADVFGAFKSTGGNVIGKTNGGTGWISTDATGTIAKPLNALLGKLASNGGPTMTVLPLTGSPALAHGIVANIPKGTTTDQRGLPRTVSGKVDSGAVETQPPGGISGTVFLDTNGDGLLSTGEKGLAGVTVYIDANKNGVFDKGETSSVTNSTGAFSFPGLPAGTYLIREVVPAGDIITSPKADDFSETLSGSTPSISGLTFADAPATASIKGRVFNDGNGDGKLDGGEAGLGLFTVTLTYTAGPFAGKTATTTTDILGDWSFTNLIAGKYTVKVTPVTGLKVTTPTGGVLTITLTAGQASANNLFGEEAVG